MGLLGVLLFLAPKNIQWGNLYRVLFGAILGVINPLQGGELHSFNDIDREMTSITRKYRSEDILIVFDVNYTLIFVDHPAMFIPNIKAHAKEMQIVMDGLSKEQQNIVIGLATKADPQKVVEECIPEVVQRLQSKGIKTLAFSAALSGDLSGLDSKAWFRTTLQSFDIDFSLSFPKLESFIFDDFSSYANSYPMYHEGIILTNKSDKGAVLVSFLKRTGYHPKVVVLIDNKKSNVGEMDAALKAFDPDIVFIGYDYNRGQEYSPQEIDNDSFLKWWKRVLSKIYTR
jgi:hypothetical protein